MTDHYGRNRYQQELERFVSQATVHLHGSLGKVGTAVVRRDGTLAYTDNALDYADLTMIARFAATCLEKADPREIQRHTINRLKVFATALDAEHAFMVFGRSPDETLVHNFLTDLRNVLPGQNAPTSGASAQV